MTRAVPHEVLCISFQRAEGHFGVRAQPKETLVHRQHLANAVDIGRIVIGVPG
jgi:hypothetical protein